MDYGILNGLGITALAIFGLWAFFKGGQAISRYRAKSAEKEDRRE